MPLPSPSPPSFFEINIFKDSYARTILQQQFHYPSELHNRLCYVSALVRYVEPSIPFASASARKKAPKMLLKLNAFFLRCTHFPRNFFFVYRWEFHSMAKHLKSARVAHRENFFWSFIDCTSQDIAKVYIAVDLCVPFER